MTSIFREPINQCNAVFVWSREAKTSVRAILRHKLHFISRFGMIVKTLTIRLFIPFPKKHKCFLGPHKCFENEQKRSFRRCHSEQGHAVSVVEESLFNTSELSNQDAKLHAEIVLCLILNPVPVGVHAVDVIIGFS